jgi:hypothetical protein
MFICGINIYIKRLLEWKHLWMITWSYYIVQAWNKEIEILASVSQCKLGGKNDEEWNMGMYLKGPIQIAEKSNTKTDAHISWRKIYYIKGKNV